MFHSGDLQSGISAAIQQHKVVACFIRSDDDEVSNEWEEGWLTELQEVITEKAVLLRLQRGSQEAGFLGAFCKIDKAPTLVIIQNGQVLEKLEAGVDREEWTDRLLNALGLGGGEAQDEKTVDLGDNPAPTDVAQAASVAANAVASAINPSTQHQDPPSSSTPSDLFPDRAAKLAADKARSDAAEAAERKARSDARRKAAEEAHEHHRGDKGKGKQSAAAAEALERQKVRDTYLVQQKQRKEEAKRDRQRILAQIEADKAERRLRLEKAKQEASSDAQSPLPESRLAGQRRSAGAGGTCSLLLRLFDGTSIRGRFPVSATLAKDVRGWIREEAPEGSGGADIPFTFRQILAPQPSRSIEVSEEHQTLQDLDLVPNATLVLVPVAGGANAYADSSSSWLGGLVSSAYQSLPNVGYFLPSFSRLYMGGTADEQEASNVQGAAMAEGSAPASMRVKTLADQRAEAARREKRAEYYNGNSSAFEGRKDEGDKGD